MSEELYGVFMTHENRIAPLRLPLELQNKYGRVRTDSIKDYPYAQDYGFFSLEDAQCIKQYTMACHGSYWENALSVVNVEKWIDDRKRLEHAMKYL